MVPRENKSNTYAKSWRDKQRVCKILEGQTESIMVFLKVANTNVFTRCNFYCCGKGKYLTIIPQARMGFESKAHEAEGRMGY